MPEVLFENLLIDLMSSREKSVIKIRKIWVRKLYVTKTGKRFM